jgi:hypothetical protein
MLSPAHRLPRSVADGADTSTKIDRVRVASDL